MGWNVFLISKEDLKYRPGMDNQSYFQKSSLPFLLICKIYKDPTVHPKDIFLVEYFVHPCKQN